MVSPNNNDLLYIPSVRYCIFSKNGSLQKIYKIFSFCFKTKLELCKKSDISIQNVSV